MSNVLGAGDAAAGFPSREARKNVMLAATAEASGRAYPVRIRNLSSWGAMIDGQAVPAAGTRFRLRRLDMQVIARAIWSEKGRSGVQFESAIDVGYWATGTYPGTRATPASQSRVDQIQAAVRSGALFPTPAPDPVRAEAPPVLSRRDGDKLIAKELLHVKAMLDAATAALSEDIEVLMRHEKALVNCDIASAILQLVADVVAADDRATAIEKVNMHEVRARLGGTEATD